MLAGVGAFIALFIVITIAIGIYAAGQDDDFAADDIGDVFEKSNAIAEYADERLKAAAEGVSMPAPPQILADQKDLQFTLVMTAVSQVFLVALVILVARQGVSGFIEQTRMGDINFGRIWLILGCVVAAYVGTYLWTVAAAATGISWLEPDSTVPQGVVRDDLTLTITGIITLVGAPVSEEMFFRGLVFGGLLRWGFWPAAVVSGFMFSLVHFDPGSFVPFVGIAVLICWIYWRRGSLWDAMAFHFIFNATSFSIMVALR